MKGGGESEPNDQLYEYASTETRVKVMTGELAGLANVALAVTSIGMRALADFLTRA